MNLVVVAVLCCSCSAGVMPPVVETRPATATADPAAMTYRSSWRKSGEVTLHGGIFHEPPAPGSATGFVVRLSDRQAFGAVGGEEVGTVILETEAGGSGSFVDLALLIRSGENWVNSDVLLLGDRVEVHGLTILDGEIVVDLTMHAANDPLCCPTLRVARRFTVQEGRLAAVVAPDEITLAGPVWQWLRTFYNDDSKAVPPRAEEFTVTFGNDGSVNVRADCNRKGGTFQARDQSLAIEITNSTRAMCPEGSLEDRFVRDLTSATHWFIKDGDLYLDLKYDTGTMRFQQAR